MLALLWVELGGKQTLLIEGTGKFKTVVAGGGSLVLPSWYRIEAVNEVEAATILNLVPHRVIYLLFYLVPPHVRDL